MDQVEVRERVGVRQTTAQLLGYINGHVDRKCDLLFCTAVPDRPKIAPFDEVHREEQLAADQPGVEHRDQVAVGQLDHDLRFIAKSRDVFSICEVRQHRLDDHQAL